MTRFSCSKCINCLLKFEKRLRNGFYKEVLSSSYSVSTDVTTVLLMRVSNTIIADVTEDDGSV